jgi:RimJ/RimL family protein N-acetyltransferase
VRLGFKWEGRIRQQFLYGGAYHDVLVYGLLRQEFAVRGAI